MLPDFRFAMGAVLAITMLGVAGFGLMSSVRLVQEASTGSLAASRTLAFTDARSRFYDPEESRRFLGISGADVLDDTSSGDAANVPATQTPALSPTVTATAGPVVRAVPSGASATTGPADSTVATPATDPDTTGTITADTPNALDTAPAMPERVASAPATIPASELQTDDDPPAQPITGVVPLPPVQPKAAAHARPKRRRFAQAARTHTAQPSDTFPNSDFSSNGSTTTQWPSYNDPFNSSAPARKPRTRVTGR